MGNLPMPCLSMRVMRSASVSNEGGEVSPWTCSINRGTNTSPCCSSGNTLLSIEKLSFSNNVFHTKSYKRHIELYTTTSNHIDSRYNAFNCMF